MSSTSEEVVISGDNALEEFIVKQVENDDILYQCKNCEFTTKSKPGVKQHNSRMHKKKQPELDKSLDLESIEKDLNGESLGNELLGKVLPPGDLITQPPSSQSDFDLNVTQLFENHEKEKTGEKREKVTILSPGFSTPKNTVSWRNKFEEKMNELTLAQVKIASLEQNLREKNTEIEVKNDIIENHVKTESESMEQMRILKSELQNKEDLLCFSPS